MVSHLVLQSFQVHKRNAGEEPYILKDCGKSFCFHSSFKRHKRTHTVEKPHECQECSKFFSSSGPFYIYKKNRPGEKPCGGQRCGKALGYCSCSSTFPEHENRKYYECGRAALIPLTFPDTKALTLVGNSTEQM